MKKVFLNSLASASLLLLAGCGFTPVHAGASTYTPSSNITIPEIEGRAGHALRKAVVEKLAAGLPGVDTATLRITLTERLRRLPIRVDATAARTDINATGRYVCLLYTSDAADE